MKLTRRIFLPLLLCLLPCISAMADFHTGQPADFALVPHPYRPGSVAVDAATQKVFVSDPVSHRILRYSSTDALQNSGAPEAIIGQPDTFAASSGTSASQLNTPFAMFVDPQGRLWVADSENHRVLRFDQATTLRTGAAASGVLGQVNFNSALPSSGPGGLTRPAGIALDLTGALWVADSGSHRVLRWNNAASLPPGAPASAVLGQTSLSTGTQNGTNASSFYSPAGLALEHSSGNTPDYLWVSDAGHFRVLGFSNPASKANGAPADKVLGQTSFTSGAMPASPQRNTFRLPFAVAVQGTSLWVADKTRVLRFGGARHLASGADASALLGQADFTSEQSGVEPQWLNQVMGLAAVGARLWIADALPGRVLRHENAATKSGAVVPDGILGLDMTRINYLGGDSVAIDPFTGKLFVCEKQASRVLRYASTAALAQGAAPELVFGQPNLSTFQGSTLQYTFNAPSGITVDRAGNLWVADTGNNRVVRYANASSVTGSPSAVQVLGQPGWTFSDVNVSDLRMNAPVAVVTEYISQPFVTRITRLWVVDSGNNRVLRFDDPLSLPTYNAPASGVLGQTSFTAKVSALTASGMIAPSGIAVEGNRLWVADKGNNRVLRYENAAAKGNGAAADGVLVQANFTTKSAPGAPSSLGIAPGGRLFAVCNTEHRILWWNSAAQKPNGAAADGALGQPDKTSTQPGPEAAELDQPTGLAVAPDGRLWVSEYYHIRRYTPALESFISGYGFDAQGRFSLTITGIPGETYEIRSSTDLQNWSTIERTDTIPADAFAFPRIWTASAPPNGSKKFYRLQRP